MVEKRVYLNHGHRKTIIIHSQKGDPQDVLNEKQKMGAYQSSPRTPHRPPLWLDCQLSSLCSVSLLGYSDRFCGAGYGLLPRIVSQDISSRLSIPRKSIEKQKKISLKAFELLFGHIVPTIYPVALYVPTV